MKVDGIDYAPGAVTHVRGAIMAADESALITSGVVWIRLADLPEAEAAGWETLGLLSDDDTLVQVRRGPGLATFPIANYQGGPDGQ
jgi:hypothetical protein